MPKARTPSTERHQTEAALAKLVQLLAHQMAREACRVQPAAILESGTAADPEPPMETTTPPAMPATNTAS